MMNLCNYCWFWWGRGLNTESHTCWTIIVVPSCSICGSKNILKDEPLEFYHYIMHALLELHSVSFPINPSIYLSSLTSFIKQLTAARKKYFTRYKSVNRITKDMLFLKNKLKTLTSKTKPRLEFNSSLEIKLTLTINLVT